jgi:ABC-2 type transport system permease protein
MNTLQVVPTLQPSSIRGRKAGFVSDVMSIAGRALRSVTRDTEFVLPALIIPVFFYFVNVGSLSNLTDAVAPGFDYKAFQLPSAIIFGVTGISRAGVVVTDVQDGYFDRLLLTPVRRLALLLGMMVADIVLVAALTVPVVLLGLITGVRFETGLAGIVALMLLSAFWGLVFTGFPYAIALKTGNPAAVNTSFILFFPFAFLTTSFLPQEALTGWMATIADYNPVTYVLAGLRSLITGWEFRTLAEGLAATLALMVVSFGLASLAMRGRVRRG